MDSKLFKDVKVGDKLAWQELYEANDNCVIAGFIQHTEVKGMVFNEDNTVTFELEGMTKNMDGYYKLTVHKYMNIDYAYPADKVKFIVGTDIKEFTAFVNAPCKNAEEDTTFKMVAHVNEDINKSIVERLKNKIKNTKWYNRYEG